MLRRLLQLNLISAACGAFLFLFVQGFSGPSEPNRFEKAQRQAVLIVQGEAQGTGVAFRRVNELGQTRWFVWTAAHVVEAGARVKVVVIHRTAGVKLGKTEHAGRILFRNAANDFALIAVTAPPEAFLAAEFASALPRIGDPVFAVGNFYGDNFDNVISTGVIAQLGVAPREIRNWDWPLLDLSSCASFPGSSGGPIFNDRSEVLGLVVGGHVPVLMGYVPVRVIEKWAVSHSAGWAVRGTMCPSDKWLITNSAR